jgi:phytoene dehydrogenase-like protein
MEKSVVIIGAGIAGLSAGCYARMNGYKTTIVEMNDKAGGLCTGWKRKGYTFDGCLDWLVGSKSGDGMHEGWLQLGAIQGKKMIDHEIFMVIEGENGQKFTAYEDADKLEQEMLRIAPEDSRVIKSFTNDIKIFAAMRMSPPDPVPGAKKPGFFESLKGFIGFLPKLVKIILYSTMTDKQFARKFKNPFLKFAFLEMFNGLDDFSLLALMFTFAWMHSKNAAYVIGGSLAFIEGIENRFKNLGGEMLFGSKVEKIIVENDKACGVRPANGMEIRADIVISAADGHATIFEMLEGKYLDAKINKIYRTFPRFPSIIQVSIGVNMDMAGLPAMVSYPLKKKLEIPGSSGQDRMAVKIFNYDPTMAPKGKTAVTTILDGNYEFWKDLKGKDKDKYNEEKKKTGEAAVKAIEERFPGFASKVEVVDIATPATYERYTGNWKASFEGWQPTPKTLMAKMPKTLPGLSNFHMIGQWVAPGGGLPSGLMTGKQVIKDICEADGKEFVTSKP